jgi:SEC-C motif domain protein
VLLPECNHGIRRVGFRPPAANILRMKKNLLAAHTPCPCGSGETYVNCCGPFHAAFLSSDQGRDGPHAPTPEALMRSRYSAYVLALIDYLLATWHPSTAPGELELSPVKWLGLEVLHAEAAGDAGVVEFVARLRDGSGRAQRMHETSRFVREDGRWYYIDGEMPQAD